MRIGNAIVVGESDDRMTCRAPSYTARRSRPMVLARALIHHRILRTAAPPIVDDRFRARMRPVVHDDNFIRVERKWLLEQSRQTAVEQREAVQRGNDDRDSRLTTRMPSIRRVQCGGG